MKFFSKKLKKGEQVHIKLQESSTFDYINPIYEWTLGLGVAVLVLLGGTAFIIFDFHTQFDASSKDQILEQKTNAYQADEVILYANQYTEKQKAFNELREKKDTDIMHNMSETVTSTQKVEETKVKTDTDIDAKTLTIDQPVEIAI